MNLNILSLIIRSLGVSILIVGVLPKAFKESKVPNGLGKLRRQIFTGLVIYTVSQTIFLILNYQREMLGPRDVLADVIAFLASLSLLTIGVVLRLIYHRDYGRVESK